VKKERNKSLDVVRKVQDIEEEVGPNNTRNASEEEATGELGPPISGLELIGLLLAAR